MTNAVVEAVAQYIGINIGNKYYTVQKGDSLWSIAKKYGVNVDDIKAANNLDTNSLSIGQILLIPGTSENTYTVKAGDSLYSIANKYNTTTNTLMELNNLKSSSLSIGQILKIPTTEIETKKDNYINYTVVSGDSLYKIANKYSTTVDEIKELNNLTSSLLNVGQILRIPTTSTQTTTYTVQKGDNLYAIANKYNTTQDEIMKLNNLTSNLLSIGQVLKIPTTSTQTITYTVQKGDSLYSIANKYNTNVDTLKSKNNLTSNALQIGQILKI